MRPALALIFLAAACGGGSQQLTVDSPPLMRINVALPKASTPAKLSYRGGRVVQHARFTAVYWGSYWASGQGATDAQWFDGMLRDLAGSPRFLSVTQEYSQPSQPIGLGSFAGRVMIATEPAAKLSDGDLQNLMNQQIRAGALPTPDENSVFMIFLPPNVALNDGYGHNSCTDFCGYHYSMWADAGQARYIALPHPDCWNCRFTWLHDGLDMDDLNRDSTTLVMSHEMIETITDPDVGTGALGWYDDANGEIADICGGSKGWFENGTIDGFRIQKEWSNADNACDIERPVQPSASGGCPGGMHLTGGVCLPDNPAGCATAGQPALLALAAVALFALRRRRRIA